MTDIKIMLVGIGMIAGNSHYVLSDITSISLGGSILVILGSLLVVAGFIGHSKGASDGKEN